MEYFSPQTVSEAVGLKRKWEKKATLIAGGTNVIPDLRAKAVHPEVLIDISHFKNLSYIREDKKKIRIGALTTISELTTSKIIEEWAPLLSQAANQIGNPLVRNRATIAGNLADASPAADTAVALLVLEAKVVAIRDGGRSRQIPIEGFFAGPNQSALEKDEIIREIVFPKPGSNAGMAYAKLGLRNSMAISVVSAAVLLEIKGQRCSRARIGLGAVAPAPIRAYQIEETLAGREITPELIEICSKEVSKEVSPITDIRASAEYRREMSSVLLKRLIQQVTSTDS